MKRSRLKLPALIFVGLAGCMACYVWFFGGPYRFVDVSLVIVQQDRLRANPTLAGTPQDSVFHYFYDGLDPSKAPLKAKLKIGISNRSAGETVVTIIDSDCQSDSTYVTCDRFTLHREGVVWIPIRHQAAWQGRGHIGWTTEPTL
jgi:hypothetical protein